MSDRETLFEMGFAPERVDWALHASGNSGLQTALDHLEEHQDTPMPENWREQGKEAEQDDEKPKSIRCGECSKMFRDMDLAMYHAEKSGHEDFAESSEEMKPLTQEEKEARLAELRARLEKKRTAKAVEDAQAQRANEIIRRKAGQEGGEARAELERQQRIKEAERKRLEKIEDVSTATHSQQARARDRVRAQIEEDKRARADKAEREKAMREGRADPVVQSAPASAPAVQKPSLATETRIRVRAPGGMWTGTFSVDAVLSDVASAVRNGGLSGGAAKMEFSTPYPRRVYTEIDLTKTLGELGLVPNAALDARRVD
ncbi:hypothetical protein MVES1_002957 [Malassezia vespertilionis]|uniref:uncharacterized protein n=1 Tax=Malassezia vespertilionis TaxID=2020962 RepID=UPI0024B22EB4|nr:uncharacterized protein MVES1_002957 [Malassezia vespertilionis]WFD07590.1 hypothetical protein MVES1_002957 [Malassezia vespertilionis]